MSPEGREFNDTPEVNRMESDLLIEMKEGTPELDPE